MAHPSELHLVRWQWFVQCKDVVAGLLTRTSPNRVIYQQLPSKWLLDEGSSRRWHPIPLGLVGDAIEELILELMNDFTVVMVTHSMSQAARVSDYTGFMYLGRMVEFNKTDKIFSDPDQELTKRYITGRFG